MTGRPLGGPAVGPEAHFALRASLMPASEYSETDVMKL